MDNHDYELPSEEEVLGQISLYSKKAEETLKDEKKTKKLLERIKSWLSKHKDNKIFGSIIDSIIDMVDLLTDYVHGEYREIPVGTLVSLVAAVLYIVSPVDLLPDWIPVVGWLDDVAIVTTILKLGLDGELRKYRMWKRAREEAEVKIRAQAVLSEAKGKIPSDEVLAAVFLTDDLKLEFLVTKKECIELPLDVRAFLVDTPREDASVDEIVALYKGLLDKMNFEWSVLGKVDLMMERDYTEFEASFEISGS